MKLPAPRINVNETFVPAAEIASEPPGATVFREGQAVGLTPFALTLPREGEAPVQAELRFALEGYEEATVVAQGLEGVVTVTKALEKKAAEPPKTPVIMSCDIRRLAPTLGVILCVVVMMFIGDQLLVAPEAQTQDLNTNARWQAHDTSGLR